MNRRALRARWQFLVLLVARTRLYAFFKAKFIVSIAFLKEWVA